MQIELKPFTRPDFARLIKWSGSAEFLTQWSGSIFRHPLDQPQLETYLRGAEGDTPVRRVYSVVDKATGNVIGHIGLDNLNLRNRSATIARVLIGDPAYRGRGIGAQMIRHILEIGFDGLHLHRIDLAVFDFNTAAIACYEKAGFVKEGLRREGSRVGDCYWSSYTMSMLEYEWRERKASRE